MIKQFVFFFLLSQSFVFPVYSLFDFDWVLSFQNEGRWSDSLTLLEKIIIHQPNNPLYLYHTALAHYKLNNFDSAQKYFHQFLNVVDKTHTTDRLKGFYNEGNSFYRLSQFDDAIASYDEALLIDHTNQYVLNNKKLAEQERDRRKQSSSEKNDNDNMTNNSENNSQSSSDNSGDRNQKENKKESESPSDNSDERKNDNGVNPSQSKESQKKEDGTNNQSDNLKNQNQKNNSESNSSDNDHTMDFDQQSSEKKDHDHSSGKENFSNQSHEPSGDDLNKKLQNSFDRKKIDNPLDQKSSEKKDDTNTAQKSMSKNDQGTSGVSDSALHNQKSPDKGMTSYLDEQKNVERIQKLAALDTSNHNELADDKKYIALLKDQEQRDEKENKALIKAMVTNQGASKKEQNGW